MIQVFLFCLGYTTNQLDILLNMLFMMNDDHATAMFEGDYNDIVIF